MTARRAMRRLARRLPGPVVLRALAWRHGRALEQLVDVDWYAARQPEAARFRGGPRRHFRRRGLRKGVSPNALFDPAWYWGSNPDAGRLGKLAALHFAIFGCAGGRSPHPLFDSSWYLAMNPDVRASGANPLAHYLGDGHREGRSPHALFDVPWYRDRVASCDHSGMDPLTQYLEHGEADGEQPNAWFDPKYYASRYSDVTGSALLHYATVGWIERRQPHPDFDPAYFMAHNPEIERANLDPLAIFVRIACRIGQPPNEAAAKPDSYALVREQWIAERAHLYSGEVAPGLLGFITTVFDTPPEYLERLTQDLIAQDVEGTFRWWVLDNGSRDAGTRQALDRIESLPWVELHRAEENLGIVGGMRFLLERAQSRYVLPLDSDDRLTHDCVRIMAASLRAAGYPELAYSDEDMTDDHSGYYRHSLKPDWDPVLFAISCYIAHLTAFDRARALELGVYDDRGVEGCHDWDTFTRFALAGAQPLHVPEVVYSWRQHAGSTSANMPSKPFVEASQRHLLAKRLALEPTGEHFLVEPSPLFDGPVPVFRIRRRARGATRVLSIDLEHGATSPAELRDAVLELAQSASLVHLLGPGIHPDDDEWRWEATGIVELFPDVAMVGGRLHHDGALVDGPRHFGFGWGSESPMTGRPVEDPFYMALARMPHSVSAVSAGHAIVNPQFLTDALDVLTAIDTVSMDDLGTWLGLVAAKRARRVVYTPYISAWSRSTHAARLVDPDELASFRFEGGHMIPDTRYLSPRLSLDADAPYEAVSHAERQRQVEDVIARLEGSRS